MKLSEAMRLGAMLKPQIEGYVFRDGRTCVLGAVLDACGELEGYRDDLQGTFSRMLARWPELHIERACPSCGYLRGALRAIVMHLNDDHRWTREAIADWVQTIEEAQEATTAEPRVDVPVLA